MKRTPRYDPKTVDPNGIKSYLSNYGNSLYNQIWENIGCPSKIIIGENGTESYGVLKDKRYGNLNSPLFDGIHQNGELGRAHYSGAVIKVFKMAFPFLQKLNSYKEAHPRMNQQPNVNTNYHHKQYTNQNYSSIQYRQNTRPVNSQDRQNTCAPLSSLPRSLVDKRNSNKNITNPWDVDTALPLYNRFAAFGQSGN